MEEGVTVGEPGSDVVRLAHDVRLACMRVSRRVRFESSEELAPHQFSVLARLAVRARTLKELAECERISPPSMSRTVAALVETGWVARADDPDDGRLVVLSLTEEGAAVLVAERAKRDVWMAERLESLSPQERATLAAATDILEAVMAQ